MAWIVGLALQGGALGAGPFDKGGISGIGARAFGMGGAAVAQAGDASAQWWNPAGLCLQKHYEISYQYGGLLGGRSADHAAVHRGHIEELGLAYGLAYRNLGSLSAFRFTEQSTLLSASLPFNEDKSLFFGATAKLYGTQLDVPGGEARGYGMDFGFLYQPPAPLKDLSLGLAVMDFQSNLEWATGVRLNPPQLLQLGAAWRFGSDTLAEFDAEVVTDHLLPTRSSQGFRAGVERWFGGRDPGLKRLAALRLGYLQSSALAPTSLSGFFTLGAGLDYKGLRLDYAYLQDVSGLGETHRVSGSWQFDPLALGREGGGPRPTRTPTPAATPAAGPTPSPTPAPAAELGLVPDSDVFAPLAGSRRSAAGFAVSFAGEAQSYSLAVTRQGNAEPVRTIKGRALPKSLRWDGKDQRGRTVPDGRYQATLRVALRDGRVQSAAAQVDVDTRRPELKLAAFPRVFEPGDEARPVQLEPRAEKASGIPQRWELVIETLEGRRLRLMEGRGTPPERLPWPGTTDTGGPVPRETLFYATFLLEMESGAVAKSARLTLGSEVTPFGQQGALKLTLATLRFEPADEVIRLEDYKALREAADAVKKYGSTYLVQVLGHADDQEAASGAVSPLELSYLRAKAARDFLAELGGLDPARVKAMGYGEERPAADNASAQGRAKNRRVEIVVYTK